MDGQGGENVAYCRDRGGWPLIAQPLEAGMFLRGYAVQDQQERAWLELRKNGTAKLEKTWKQVIRCLDENDG
jgi:hypothetical protein